MSTTSGKENPMRRHCVAGASVWTVAALLTTALVAQSGTVKAADPLAATEPATQPTAAAVTRYLNDSTLGVIRTDLSAVPLDRWIEWGTRLAKRAGWSQQQINGALAELRGPAARGRNWLGAMQRAGAREVDVVVNVPILFNLPYGIVPLQPGASAEEIEAQMEGADILKVGPSGSDSSDVHEVKTAPPSTPDEAKEEADVLRKRAVRARKVGDAVLYGTVGTIEALQRAAATEPAAHRRPDIEEALAADAGAPIVVTLAPSRALMEPLLADDLPKELKGIRWAALAITPPPKVSLRFTVQCEGEQQANDLQRAVLDGVANLRARDEPAAEWLKAAKGLLPLLSPRVEGTRLEWFAEGEQLDGSLVNALHSFKAEGK